MIDRQDYMIARQDRLEQMFKQFMESSNKDGEDDRLVYSDVVATYRPKTPARLFVSFFKDSLHVLYYKQLKTKK